MGWREVCPCREESYLRRPRDTGKQEELEEVHHGPHSRAGPQWAFSVINERMNERTNEHMCRECKGKQQKTKIEMYTWASHEVFEVCYKEF